MKAKIYIGILAAVTLAVLPAKAQVSGYGNFRNDEATLVVNNYYSDYDYYYSSRINRFHREYSAFSYYSPVFTETYWYNYQPHSWGISIYGGGGFGFGYYDSYPVYNYGWYDPYYGYNYGWGYDPFYNNWYSPVFVSVRYRNIWAFNDRGWYGHNYWYGNYRPVYNTYNYYNYSAPRYSSREYQNRSGQTENNRTNGTVSRRSEPVVPGSGRDVNNTNNVNYGRQTNTETRRSSDAGTTRTVENRSSNYGNNSNNSNNGNNRNSVENGNNGNFGNNNRNNQNNGNNNNSQPGGNNGNFGNKSNISAPASTTRRAVISSGSSNQSSGRSVSAPSRSSSSSVSSTPSRTSTSTSKSSSTESSTRSSSSSSGSGSSTGSTGRRR